MSVGRTEKSELSSGLGILSDPEVATRAVGPYCRVEGAMVSWASLMCGTSCGELDSSLSRCVARGVAGSIARHRRRCDSASRSRPSP